MLQNDACLQVATAAFKTLMALLGDTHQYEALLGCRSSLPTGQSSRAFWNTSESHDTDAKPHASNVQRHWQAICQVYHSAIGVTWQRIFIATCQAAAHCMPQNNLDRLMYSLQDQFAGSAACCNQAGLPLSTVACAAHCMIVLALLSTSLFGCYPFNAPAEP